MPRKSGAKSGLPLPAAFEQRTIVRYALPGCAKPTRKSSDKSSFTRSSASSTARVALA